MAKSPGSTDPGSATTTRSPTAKLVAPQTMSRGSDSPAGEPKSTLTAQMGFLNSVSSSISTTLPISQGTADGSDRGDPFDLMSDPDQGLLEFIG